MALHINSSRAISAAIFLWLAQLSAVYSQPNQTTRAETPVSATSSLAVGSMDSLDRVRILRKGDVLSFRIAQESDPPVPLTVDASGEIEIPNVGRAKALGKTCRQLAMEIKALLDKDQYVDSTVLIALQTAAAPPTQSVMITGQVTSIGLLEIPQDEKLMLREAIVRSGGFTDFADKRRVRVTRTGPDGKGRTFKVDLKEIIEKGHTEKDIPLKDKDLIFVPERLFNF